MSTTVYTSFVLVCPAVIDLGHGQFTSLSIPSQTSPATATNTGASNPSVTPTRAPFPGGSSGNGQLGPGSSTLFATAPAQPTYVLVAITTTLTVDVFPTGLVTLDGYRPTYKDYGDVSLNFLLLVNFGFLIPTHSNFGQGSLVTTLFDSEVPISRHVARP